MVCAEPIAAFSVGGNHLQFYIDVQYETFREEWNIIYQNDFYFRKVFEH